jgi:hypothetical protein
VSVASLDNIFMRKICERDLARLPVIERAKTQEITIDQS